MEENLTNRTLLLWENSSRIIFYSTVAGIVEFWRF